MSKFISGVGIVLALVLSVLGLVGGHQSAPGLGGVTNYDSVTIAPTTYTEGLKIGTSTPTLVNNLIKGTCNLLGMDTSQAATSTASYDCAVTGVVPGDTVIATLGTTTQNTIQGSAIWSLQSAKASTTAGYVTFRVTNLTGAAVVPSTTSIGSSTQYLILR